jgi:hypothetical protein
VKTHTVKKLAIASTIVLLAGCGASTNTVEPPRTGPVKPVVVNPTAINNNPTRTAQPTPALPAPTIPEGAVFTIFCQRIPGPGNIEQGNQLRDALIQATGMRDWYLVHSEGESFLFYGYYKAIDPKSGTVAEQADAARAMSDRKSIEAIVSREGDKMFPGALLQPIDTADPTAPPEWNLAAAKPGAVWSVQIAAFTMPGKRKEAAVQAVRELREKGIEAYYWHGPSISSVCVGSWGKDALKAGEAYGRNPRADKTVLIDLSGRASPEELDRLETETGIKTARTGFTIVDKTINQIRAAYPHSVDYQIELIQVTDRKTNTPRAVPRPGMLVPIPRDQKVQLDTTAPGNEPDPRLIQPSNGNLGNRLRGIGQ